MKHLSIAIAALLVVPVALPAATPAARPNIIVILADDMGFSDLGCYGSEIETPNLDRLAATGVRFTQFYNASRCCPSRASILTGLYAHQTGVGHMIGDAGLPAYQGRLNDRCVTIAELLKEQGYATIMAGKWHVGGEDFGVTPWQRGFNASLSAKAGGFYYGKRKELSQLWLNGRQLSGDSPELPEDWYSTDLFTDFSIGEIQKAVSSKRPFFVYLAHTAPHFPLQAPAADVAKYRGKYKLGWEKLRELRYERQLRSGLIDRCWPLSPLPKGQPHSEDVPAWDSLSEEQKDRSDQIMALYAACVDHMDQSVGRLSHALEELHVLENTLILFLSDNGGSGEGSVLGKLGQKPRGPSAFCGEAWATLQNTPFRYYKHFEHEGGVATPLIAHWPKGIPKPGIFREPAHVIDILPTCADLAGARYPSEWNGKKVLPAEGKSLRPAFSGQPIGQRELFWEHSGQAAVRSGDWKLVCVKKQPWELYNLTKDRTELNNLISREPARAKALEAKWDAWAKRTGVFPKPDKPKFEKRGESTGESM